MTKSPIPFKEYDRIWCDAIGHRQGVGLYDDMRLWAGLIRCSTTNKTIYWYLRVSTKTLETVWELQYYPSKEYVIVGDAFRIVSDLTYFKMK